MTKICILKTMENAESAQHLFDYFRDKGMDMSGAGIMDGATFTITVDVGAATIAASHFYDFFKQK